MLKRGAEEESPDASASKKAGGKSSSGSGKILETAVDPIPRLFRQNSITLHFTQRTWEEIGPGELKYLPICFSPAAIMDKFHIKAFNKYIGLASTYEIHTPHIRISDIIMLQDTLITQSGTPSLNSIYTQACYMMMFEPQGVNNWYKLGTTDDCGETQQVLTYKFPHSKQQQCGLVTGMININGFKDFEKLVFNPAYPYFTGGWSQDNTQIIKGQREDLEDERDIIVSNNYIAPSPGVKLNQFSCSLRGTDKFLPLGEHTTMARNLDKIKFFEHGQTYSFDIDTNLEGVKLINHPLNSLATRVIPVGPPSTLGVTEDPDKDFNLLANYNFVYPSNNRPFYSRHDNMSIIGPTEGAKDIGHIKHKFFCMPPIKKADGNLIAQRVTFLLEQSFSVTMHYPETTTDDGAIKWMLNQSNGVLLRPALDYIQSIRIKDKKTPDGGDYDLPDDFDCFSYKDAIATGLGIWTMIKKDLVKKLLRDNGYCMIVSYFDRNGVEHKRDPETYKEGIPAPSTNKFVSPDKLPLMSEIDRGPECFYENLLPFNDVELKYMAGTSTEKLYFIGTCLAEFIQTLLYTKKGFRDMKNKARIHKFTSTIYSDAKPYLYAFQDFIKERFSILNQFIFEKIQCDASIIELPMSNMKIDYWPR